MYFNFNFINDLMKTINKINNKKIKLYNIKLIYFKSYETKTKVRKCVRKCCLCGIGSFSKSITYGDVYLYLSCLSTSSRPSDRLPHSKRESHCPSISYETLPTSNLKTTPTPLSLTAESLGQWIIQPIDIRHVIYA